MLTDCIELDAVPWWVRKRRREAWIRVHGVPRKGLYVAAMKCRNPACINPDHAQAVTRQAYMRAIARPISADHRLRIERAKHAAAPKLNLERAREIRRLRCEGESRAAVAQRMGISETMVRWVEKGRAWREPSPFAV